VVSRHEVRRERRTCLTFDGRNPVPLTATVTFDPSHTSVAELKKWVEEWVPLRRALGPDPPR
jgi:hypothetical protein